MIDKSLFWFCVFVSFSCMCVKSLTIQNLFIMPLIVFTKIMTRPWKYHNGTESLNFCTNSSERWNYARLGNFKHLKWEHWEKNEFSNLKPFCLKSFRYPTGMTKPTRLMLKYINIFNLDFLMYRAAFQTLVCWLENVKNKEFQ